ncbi:MAG TPA: GeoRSP system SPASM domain protein [Geobacteraceae bacterium]|nr:GeoRSP system SPASM domain protein [Geobacteraceae bacterium]
MELAAPISIYWDLPAGKADTASLLRTCADIVACRPLMLHLHDPGPEIGGGTIAVLERLRGGAIAVSLTIRPTALDDAAAALLCSLGLKEILLTVESVQLLPAGTALKRFFDGKDASPPAHPTMGISFPVTRENWRELPTLVAFCRKQGISRLVLPMQRLYTGENPFLLTRREQQELAGSLAASGGVEGIALTIHDPFLWRAFNPDTPFPQGGCQAANTMLAIAPDGGVYPCPVLPVLLGVTGETSLKEIIASPEKKGFRRRLLDIPDDCRGCEELTWCRGGCRGRAYVVRGTLKGADAACE